MLRLFAHFVALCWMLLRVLAQSLQPVKLFSQQLPAFLLFCDHRSVAQQCWIRLHSSSSIVGAAHKDLWVVSFPRCTEGPNIVGSCCIRLQTTVNTDAALHYSMLHRFEIFSAPGTIAHGSIRLPPQNARLLVGNY